MNQEHTSIYNVSFENGKLRKWIHSNRRVGRPKMNWTEESIREIWDIVKRGKLDPNIHSLMKKTKK